MDLDLTALEDILEIEAGGETGLLKILFESYSKQAPDLMEKMNKAVATEDWSAAEAAAHSLKSSSAALGLKDLAASLADVEHRSKTRMPAEDIRASYSQARTLLEPSLACLRDFVALKGT
jgi:HPt (histidine-containing phosphotransfer) domain-containing protein